MSARFTADTIAPTESADEYQARECECCGLPTLLCECLGPRSDWRPTPDSGPMAPAGFVYRVDMVGARGAWGWSYWLGYACQQINLARATYPQDVFTLELVADPNA